MNSLPTSRNLYLDGDRATAVTRGYDLVQLKYDGWWTKAVCSAGRFGYYSQTDNLFGESDGFGLDGCILIGEFMRGTQWSQAPERKGRFFIYDIWQLFGQPIEKETYNERYRLLRQLKLPSVFTLVNCFRISDANAVWDRYVLREGFEGIVFRRTGSTLDDAVMREKREYSIDGTVVGFEPGNGKYEGSLGAVRVSHGEGAVTLVGGGFTDAERMEIWTNQTAYLGRVMEFTANAIFDSGTARHPRFVRWRDDKTLTALEASGSGSPRRG